MLALASFAGFDNLALERGCSVCVFHQAWSALYVNRRVPPRRGLFAAFQGATFDDRRAAEFRPRLVHGAFRRGAFQGRGIQ